MKKILLGLLLTTSLMGCNPKPALNNVTAPPKQESLFGTPDNKTALVTDNSLFRKNIFIIFDMSGSMDELACQDHRVSKSKVAKDALNKFIKNIPSNVAIGMVIFWDGEIHLISKVETGNHERLLNAVSSVSASGGTPLGESFDVAKNELVEASKSQMGYGDYSIIAVTDGESNGTRSLENAVDTIVSTTPIQISTAGFCINTRHALNRPGITKYADVGNEQTLNSALSATLAETETFKDTTVFK